MKFRTQKYGKIFNKGSFVKMKWYLVLVQENFECVAKKAIEEKVRAEQMEEFFGAIVIPNDNDNEPLAIEEENTGPLYFPGFIFVQMILNEQTANLLEGTPKVTHVSVTGGRRAV